MRRIVKFHILGDLSVSRRAGDHRKQMNVYTAVFRELMFFFHQCHSTSTVRADTQKVVEGLWLGVCCIRGEHKDMSSVCLKPRAFHIFIRRDNKFVIAIAHAVLIPSTTVVSTSTRKVRHLIRKTVYFAISKLCFPFNLRSETLKSMRQRQPERVSEGWTGSDAGGTSQVTGAMQSANARIT